MSDDAASPAPTGEANLTLPNFQEKVTHNQAIRRRIGAAINAKREAPGSFCSICGHRTFTVGDYVPLSVAKSPEAFQPFPKSVYPCVAIICTVCGNTHLLNLGILGFKKEDWASLTLVEDSDDV